MTARRLHLLTFLAAAVTIARLWVVVLGTPYIAFGNNFDFIRQSSCIGLWEDYGDRPKTSPHPEGPSPRLVFDGDRQKYLCMFSIDNVFPYLAAHMHPLHDRVELHEIGLWKALLASAGIVLVLLQPMPSFARLCVALALALSLGDIDALSYANTLYLEFSVVLAGVLALASGTALTGATQPPRWRSVALLAATLAWLALSKQQYGGLAVGLALICAWIIQTRWRRTAQAAALLAVALSAAVAFSAMNATKYGLVGAAGNANRTDTVLGAVLPAASDRTRALQILGLPASCAPAIGKTWYTPGLQQNHPCPAVLRMSRWRLAKLFVLQPTTLSVPLAHAITLSQKPAGNETTRWQEPGDALLLRSVILQIMSPTYWLASLPAPLYRALVAAMLTFGTASLGVLLLRYALASARNGKGSTYGQAMVGLGGFAGAYTLVSTVFGDGYQDVHRHAALLPACLVFIVVGAVLALYEARKLVFLKKAAKALRVRVVAGSARR